MARSRDRIWVAARPRTGPRARPVARIAPHYLDSVTVALHRCLETGLRKGSNLETGIGREGIEWDHAGTCIKRPLPSHLRLHPRAVDDHAQE